MVASLPLSNSLLCRRSRWGSVACGSTAMLIGLTALLGWITGNRVLQGGLVAGITMKSNAAVCVALLGLIVCALGLRERIEQWFPRWIIRAASGLVLGVGTATLAQHLFRVNLGIDELLFREAAGAVATQSPNRMGPIAALCLSLLGLAGLLAHVRSGQQRAPFQYLVVAVALITSVPLLGYLFQAWALFTAGKYTGIALPTAVALWLVAVGFLLSVPEVGFMRRLVAGDGGALLLRRLLPAALLIPVLLMWMVLQGQEAGLYDADIGRGLAVLGFVVVFSSVVWRTGNIVSRQAVSAARAERVLHNQLVQSHDALADADRRKTRFLAVLAHELRNPLAPVRSAVHLLRARHATDAEATRAYVVIERQIAHLARLIDDLMDVSRISQDKLELRKAPVRFSEVVAGALEASRHLIERERHQLSIALPQQEVQLEADAERLVQVFTSLLSNAARYTPAGGEIVLSARLEPPAENGGAHSDQRQLVVSVQDNGLGIAAQQLPRVFDMFYQAGPDAQHRRQGLGVGLALVRKLVELHGGSVSAASAGVGRGSTFTVRLQAAALPAPTLAPGARLAPILPGFRSLRVLVVEDNPDSAEMLGELLRVAGAEVHIAPDGESGLELGARVQPRVILLDIGLPGMSGYEVARQVRDSDWGAQVFIVALTGWGSADDRLRSKAAGIDRHMVKPVNPEGLMALLSEFRSSSSARGASPSAPVSAGGGERVDSA